jgi:hypothetical protein
MLTSKLEDLIWKGKAFPKTLCVGGTQKQGLDIQQDRFIIITDLLYFPFIANTSEEAEDPYIPLRVIAKWIESNNISTQLTILGEKNFNRFQFRNNVGFVSDGQDKFLGIPQTPTHVDTYLIHTTGVSFTFSFGVPFIPTDGVNLADTFAYSNPVDYGKLGDPVVDVTTQINDVSTSVTSFQNFYTRKVVPLGFNAATNELAYPVDNDTNIQSFQRKYGNGHPIVQVSYIEVLGSPNNIGL